MHTSLVLLLKKSPTLAQRDLAYLVVMYCTADWKTGPTGKVKEKFLLTSNYPRVVILGNLQVPSKNISQCLLNKQKSFSLGLVSPLLLVSSPPLYGLF